VGRVRTALQNCLQHLEYTAAQDYGLECPVVEIGNQKLPPIPLNSASWNSVYGLQRARMSADYLHGEGRLLTGTSLLTCRKRLPIQVQKSASDRFRAPNTRLRAVEWCNKPSRRSREQKPCRSTTWSRNTKGWLVCSQPSIESMTARLGGTGHLSVTPHVLEQLGQRAFFRFTCELIESVKPVLGGASQG
jgi:hypothetical protein